MEEIASFAASLGLPMVTNQQDWASLKQKAMSILGF
jgi:hypothetical protein